MTGQIKPAGEKSITQVLLLAFIVLLIFVSDFLINEAYAEYDPEVDVEPETIYYAFVRGGTTPHGNNDYYLFISTSNEKRTYTTTDGKKLTIQSSSWSGVDRGYKRYVSYNSYGIASYSEYNVFDYIWEEHLDSSYQYYTLASELSWDDDGPYYKKNYKQEPLFCYNGSSHNPIGHIVFLDEMFIDVSNDFARSSFFHMSEKTSRLYHLSSGDTPQTYECYLEGLHEVVGLNKLYTYQIYNGTYTGEKIHGIWSSLNTEYVDYSGVSLPDTDLTLYSSDKNGVCDLTGALFYHPFTPYNEAGDSMDLGSHYFAYSHSATLKIDGSIKKIIGLENYLTRRDGATTIDCSRASMLEEIDLSSLNPLYFAAANFSNCRNLKTVYVHPDMDLSKRAGDEVLTDSSFYTPSDYAAMFDYCYSLEGGNGTKYIDLYNMGLASNYQEIRMSFHSGTYIYYNPLTYAHADQEGNPGLFTAKISNTVNFYSGNTLLFTQKIPQNKQTALTKHPEPQIPAGWTFYGWAESTDTGSRLYTDGQKITLDTNGKTYNFFAVYRRNILFKQGDGTTTTATQQYYNGNPQSLLTSDFPLTIKKPAEGGWTAIDWSESTKAEPGGITVTAGFIPNKTTYYSTFSRTLTVTYNKNSGTGTTAATKETQYLNSSAALSGNTLLLAANGFTAPTSKEFKGWNTNASGTGTTYAEYFTYRGIGKTTSDAYSVTLYAQWESKNKAPTILVQPASQNVDYGKSVKLSVTATAPGTLSYQWQQSGNNSTWSNISGATGYSYDTPTSAAIGKLYYRCVVSSAMTGVDTLSSTSTTATITTVTVPNTISFWDGSILLTTQAIPQNTATALQTSNLGTPYGWTFYGWAEVPDTATRTYTSGQKVTLTSIGASKNLYAIYRRTISFKQGNGTTNTGVVQSWYGGSKHGITVPAITAPTNGNWTALGWTQDPSVLSSNISVAAGTTSFMPETTQYYSVFSRTLSVAYDKNGGTGTIAQSSKTQYLNSSDTNKVSDNTVYLASNGFTAPQNTDFVGWNASGSASNPCIAPGGAYSELGKTAASTVLSASMKAAWASRNRAPSILGQPGNTSVTYGTAASLTVSASAPGILSYQWQSLTNGTSWTNVSGATAATYKTSNKLTADGSHYFRCVITSKMEGVADMSATTSSAKVTVSKRRLTVNWGTTTFEYDGLPHVPDATAGNVVTGDDPAFTVLGAKTNAGMNYSAEISSVITGAGSANYDIPTTKTTLFSILPAPVPFPSAPIGPNGPLTGGEVYVFAENSGEKEIGRNFAFADAVFTAASSDTRRTRVSLNDGVLKVEPLEETGVVTPVRITVSAPATENYQAYLYYADVYVSGKAAVTKIYSPDTDTSGNVTCTLTVSDPYTALDPTHTIDPVTGVEIEGNTVAAASDGTYTVVFSDNDVKAYRITDSFGYETAGELKVDWIDREKPSLELSVLQKTDYGVLVHALSEDNRTPYGELEYCWGYKNDATDVWLRNVSVKSFPANSEVKVAVRDRAGNLTEDTISTGRGGKLEEIEENIAARTIKMLKDVSRGDISSYTFGDPLYMDAEGRLHNYSTDPIELRIQIEPGSVNTFIEGYLSINSYRVPVEWYLDSAYTVPSGQQSTDGKGVSLAVGPNYGKLQITKDLVGNKTLKNATATLYLITYSAQDRTGKMASEYYSMSYSVDLTPPSISTSYDVYTHKLDIRATDSLSGLADGKIQVQLGSEAPKTTAATYTETYPSAGTAPFNVRVTAKDKLGNESVVDKTYKPSEGANTGGYVPSSSTDGLDTYFSKSRLFNKYLINGTRSNADVASVPIE